MTSRIIRITRTALLAATIGGAFAAPAMAGGSLSLSYAPQDARQAQALQAGLQVYAIVKNVQGGASVRQIGKGNSAALGQQGAGNLGIIHQKGKGHTGTLQQTGNQNAFGLFQFGKKTKAAVSQTGNGNSGAVFQFGW
jgi:hypothetical protein